MTRAFDIQDWYILMAAAIALLIYTVHGILLLIDHIRNKKAKIIQQADEETRQEIEETIKFLEDETSSKLSEQKKAEYRMIILNRLKKAERANREIIKKLIMEEAIKQKTAKKEKLKKEAVFLIIKDVLDIFRKEFFRKMKKVIAEAKKAKPKKRDSRAEEERRMQEEQRRDEQERIRKEREEKRRSEQEKSKEEMEAKIREMKEKERRLEEERQKREKEEKERQAREEAQKKVQQKKAQKAQGQQNSVGGKSSPSPAGGRGGNSGR